MVTIREDVTLEVVLRYLRRIGELPSHTDTLFVVDRQNALRGILMLNQLLLNEPEAQVSALVQRDVVTFHPDDDAHQAAEAFERYNLISAPVVDPGGKLIGRLTVEAVMDYIRETTDTELLKKGGLREEEDIFAPVWNSLRNRWTWLAINMVTAFIASRVIGAFEGSIEKIVALAALMPIVAGIGGNSGNQTITMIVRALALGQITGMQRAQAVRQGASDRARQRPPLGNHPRRGRVSPLQQLRARHGDDGRDDPQPAARGARRRDHPVRHVQVRTRPGGRVERDDHRSHGQRRILHLPRPRDTFPDLKGQSSSRLRCPMCTRLLPRFVLVALAILLLAGCSPLAALNATIPDAGIRRQPESRLRHPSAPEAGRLRADAAARAGAGGRILLWRRVAARQRADYKFVAEALTSKGFVVVIPDYRLYPEVRFPAFLDDGGAAVAWTQKEIGRYGGDPQRIFVMGHSAGAYNAAMLAFDPRYVETAGGRHADVIGFIGLAGPYDFLPFTSVTLENVFGAAPDLPATQPATFVERRLAARAGALRRAGHDRASRALQAPCEAHSCGRRSRVRR